MSQDQMPPDINQRFLIDHTDVRGELTQIHHSLAEICSKHHYPDAVKVLLGQLMAAASLMAARLKIDGSMILQTYGDGPLRTLMAEINHLGEIRAIARFESLPDDQPLLGSGRLVITTLPAVGPQYQGMVHLQGDDLSKTLEEYFLSSEQIKTRLWLACDGTHAGGLLLQALPISSEQASLDLDDDAFNRASILADTLTTDELTRLPPERLLHRLYHQESLQLFAPKHIHFGCSCSRARVESALLQMGEDEVRSILAEDGDIEVDCQFCYEKYRFDLQQVESLFNSHTH